MKIKTDKSIYEVGVLLVAINGGVKFEGQVHPTFVWEGLKISKINSRENLSRGFDALTSGLTIIGGLSLVVKVVNPITA
jgi:hypothetical protein